MASASDLGPQPHAGGLVVVTGAAGPLGRRVCTLAAAEAIFQACIVRFRPIMMTTLAALAGTLPIALGWGAGAESRRTLGLAVVGGLMVSQLLTLYITPVFYLYMERFTKYLTPKPVPADADAFTPGTVVAKSAAPAHAMAK